MNTVLQRQNVSKRATPPVHLRARTNGVRWSTRAIPTPVRAPSTRPVLQFQAPKKIRLPRLRPRGEHSFLQRQFIPRQRRRAARKVERKFLRRAERARGQQRRTAPRGNAPRVTLRGIGAAALHRPWLLILLAGAALLCVLVPAIGMTGVTLPQQRPALPAPADPDQALYGLAVPEPASRPEGGVNPVLLTSLKVTPYTTRAGDSLSRIAARFNLNIDTVVSWNSIRDARSMPTGTQLDIPNSNGLKYTVRRGDTLQGIAQSSSLELNSILDWNRLSSSVISVGQELFLPGARMSANELNRILGNLFMYPVQGRISSYFGERSDPFTGVERFHNGVDIVNKPLTAIQAAMAGTVGDVGFSADFGYYVILKHSGSYQTLYGHLTRYIVGRGQKVQQGQKIGELGTTGYSTGPHLHFSIFHNGEAVDPLRFLK